MTLSFFDAASWATTVSPATCVATWANGDEVLIWGFGESDSATLATPTATGLGTATLVTSSVTASNSSAYLWRATATSAQAGQTISSTKGGGSLHAGIAATVIPGGVSALTALAGSNAEAPFNTTVAAGDGVAVGFGDFSATLSAAGSPSTGSGTATSRVEFVNSQHGVWIADWEGTAAGTFDFGRSAYNDTALVVAQVGARWTPAATATVDQEGFRFGEDDGSESAHTWAAAQDTDLTAALGAKLLRILLNTTGDEPAITPTLRAQKNGAGGYLPVPVGASVAEAWGTVTFGAIGTGANGTTTVAPSYPTGITAGQYLTCVVTSGGTGSPTPSTPSGWTLLATGASTDGTFGLDAGPRRCTVFGKVADGTETGTLTVTITSGDTCRGTISRWTKAGSGSWVVDGYGADDSTSGTGVSMTFASVDWHDGDAVLVATGQRVDSATQSAQSLTATGITFGTRTNRAATAVTTGNDHRHTVDTFAAVTNADPTENAAPTWAYTASAAASAGGVLVRLREYTAPVTNELYVAASSNFASGGEATTPRLTAPSGKTTADHDNGRRWDDENGADTWNPAADKYGEFEFSLATQSPAVAGDFWDFRIYAGAAPADTYTLTPRWTIGSGSTDYTKTPADPVGVTDARTVSQALARSQGDTVGVTDARAVTQGRTRADAVGVTDTRTVAQAVTRTVADPVGATDARTVTRTVARTHGDPVAVTDSVTVVRSVARTAADPVGLTDSAAAQRGPTAAPADPVGVTDAVTVVRTTVRGLADPAGVTDSASGSMSGGAAEPTLLDTFALASADPHTITITGATVGHDVWLVVNCGAAVTTPAGWSVAASRVADMGSYAFTLPAASNPGGDIAVSLDLSAARALAAVAFETPPIDTATNALYGSLVAPTGGGAVVGTAAHTFATREIAVAVFCLDDTTGTAPTFAISSFDNGFTTLGDSGWAESAGSEGARVVLGWAPATGFTADGVTLTLTASATGRSAAGFLAFDVDTSGLFLADPVGVTDARTVVATSARTQGDPVGVTDAAAPTRTVARTQGDAVAVTDAVTADLAGGGSFSRTPADPVGVTDSAAKALAASRARADAVGVTDTAARSINYVRTVADAVTVTDTGAPQTLDIGYTHADAVAVTDARTVTRASARAVADPVGATDSVSVDLTGAIQRNPADPVGLTDSAARVAVVARARADTIAVSDAVTAVLVGAGVRNLADPVTVTDSLVVVLAVARAVADLVGVTDAASVPGSGATWQVSRAATLGTYRALLDGVHPTTATIT